MNYCTQNATIMTFRPELLDELLKEYKNPEDLIGKDGLLKQLTTALVERCLNAEMAHHLEEERQEATEPAPLGIGAMDTARKRSRGSLARQRLPSRATGTGHLSQSW
jgi:transposase-like protein